MPYIKPELRQQLDPVIDDLITKIRLIPDDKDGICNYAISRIVASAMKPETGWRYVSLSRAHEVFNAAGSEFYDRLLRKYEDLAVEKNSDLEEYEYPGF